MPSGAKIACGGALLCLLVTGASAVQSALAADIPIDQQHKEFIPDNITIKAGDTLVFSNHDSRVHNILVVNPDGLAKDEGLQKPDVVLRHTFTTPGAYEVRCAIHPEMLLTVTVE
jgi:plastocyanin